MQKEQAYWLAWSQISGIGAVSLQKIVQHFGSLQKAWHAQAIAFREIDGLGHKIIMVIEAERPRLDPQALLEKCLQANPHFWTPVDPDYPRLLQEIASSPPLLYYSGQVERQENQGITPAIAIVGTRNPSPYGKRWANKITQALVQHGFCIVSGMAAGVDTVAHRSCLEAGGRTIAVLGTGVDVVYPYSNRDLHQQLQTEGLIVSEYPAQTPPDRGHFPARNRIIAGLSRAVIIIEAPQRSGALITARFANDFGRDVYVLPGSLDNPQSLGCLALLNSGAHVILSIPHLLEMLGTMPCLDYLPEVPQVPELAPELAEVYKSVAREAISLDAIAQATSKTTAEILVALAQLELMDLVVQLPGMRYQLKL